MCQATKPLRATVDAVEKRYASAVFAGIVPDARHLSSGGFHVCLIHLEKHGKLGDYSSSRPLDRPASVSPAGKGFSCAIDVSLAKADMKRVHASVKKVHGDRSDPRRKYINAINCWPGYGSPKRYNFQTNTVSNASKDHETHVHGDQPRAYVDVVARPVEAAKAARAMASVLIGESKAAWVAREEAKPVATKPTGKAPTKPVVWTVKAGDTLYAIARAGGVTVAQVKAWNRLTSDDIFPGQTFRLTAPPVPKPAPKPAPAVKVPVWPVGPRDYFRPKADPKKYLTVQRWQKAMRDHGWAIVDDGFLGPKSGKVVTAFQRAEGLKVTGLLDKPTFVRAFTTKRRGR